MQKVLGILVLLLGLGWIAIHAEVELAEQLPETAEVGSSASLGTNRRGSNLTSRPVASTRPARSLSQGQQVTVYRPVMTPVPATYAPAVHPLLLAMGILCFGLIGFVAFTPSWSDLQQSPDFLGSQEQDAAVEVENLVARQMFLDRCLDRPHLTQGPALRLHRQIAYPPEC